MGIKVFLKNPEGNYRSTDSRTGYTLLQGKDAYEYLQSEERVHKFFYEQKEDNGDVVMIETSAAIADQCKKEKNRKDYVETCKKESGFTMVSLNGRSRQEEMVINEDAIELLVDESVNVEDKAIRNVYKNRAKEFLKTLSTEDFTILYCSYLIEKPMSENELAAYFGVSRKVIRYRKTLILRAFKSFLEKT